MTDFPFLERIPPDKRLTVIDRLGRYQQKKHGCELDCVTDLRAGRYNPLEPASGHTVVDAPLWQELEEIDREREPARNTEIKERVK